MTTARGRVAASSPCRAASDRLVGAGLRSTRNRCGKRAANCWTNSPVGPTEPSSTMIISS